MLPVLSAALLGLALQPSAARAQGLPDFADLVEKVGPAVVNIRTTERAPDGPRMPLNRRAPTLQQGDEVPRGEGSGFLLSADGFLLTNAHVVAGATEVYVTLTDKREFKAKIIGTDERTDVALVKIDAAGLPFLRIGDVNRLRVGEWVLAIGSPFGLDNSVTAGIVSAKQRETGREIPFLQTDVAVNPGNSGGPLINVRGEVVGINSQIVSTVGGYIGISFAIPIDEAMRIADQLKAQGHVVRGYLGILPTDVTREQSEDLGLGKSKSRGAFVRQVIPGGPADKAGIRPGDIVLTINNKPVEGAVELRRMLGVMKPGSVVALQIHRNGKLIDFKPVLTEMTPQAAAAGEPKAEPTEPKTSVTGKPWGLSVTNLTDTERTGTRGVGGVKVTAVSGGAEAVGLKPGDIIQAVAGNEVTDVKQFDAVVAKLDKAKPLSLSVLRGDWAQFVRVPALK